MITSTQYKKTYKLAKRLMNKSFDVHHDWGHIQRVLNNSGEIVSFLNLSRVDERILNTCCLLHDILYCYKKPGIVTYFFEGPLAKKRVDRILKDLQFSKADRKVINNAIKVHHLSFPFAKLNRSADVYSKILQDADTIDYFSRERISPFKKWIKRNYIRKVIYFFVVKLTNYGKDNIEEYLNYPQIGKYYYPHPKPMENIFPDDTAMEGVKID